MSAPFVWQGRIDTEEVGDSRRWHQCVQPFTPQSRSGVALIGFAVDEGVRMSDLKGVLYEWSRQMFGHDRKIIFHHSYFPFVEPGVEMAIDCFICRGNGKECRTCHGTGWIEILGAGMVHPEIIETAGYDSSKVTGFAFGIGVERVALLRWASRTSAISTRTTSAFSRSSRRHALETLTELVEGLC